MRWILLLCLVLGLLACRDPQTRPRKNRLTVYCSAQIEWCQIMVTEFERATGIRVSMTRKSSGETYAQVLAERKNPKGDVWWGGTGDAHIQASESKLTESYRSPRLEELHSWADDLAGDGENRATGIYMGVLGFAYNRDWLNKRGLPAPRTWSDLIGPDYRGEIQVANPSSSGTAYTALVTFVELYGEDRAFQFLRKLHANVNQYTKSGAAPATAAGRGETGVGITFLHDATTQKVAGFPLELVAPEEGTGYEIGGMSLIRGARHPENARIFFDWALSRDAQALGQRAGSFQIPSNRTTPLPEFAPDPNTTRLIDLDLARWGKKAERTRLLERWAREVAS